MSTPHRRVLSGKETERRTNVGRIQRWRKIKEGKFPAPIEIGPNQIGWFEDEIEEWLASRPRRTYGAPLPDDKADSADQVV